MSNQLSDPPKARRWPRRLAMGLITTFLVVGPWPVDDSSFDGSEYQRRTLDRLDASTTVETAGPIRIGLAEVDLTPPTPRPLAGFIGQIRTPFVGVDTPCLARALTVESASGPLTVLTADLLLVNAKLARAACDRARVRLDEVFFTASHTHGGPGGWGDHPLEMLVAGAYDPAFFDWLADRLAGVIRDSRARLEPAELGFVQIQARDRQSNRIDPTSTTHDALSALVFRAAGGPSDSSPLAILVVFGAHATISHPVPPRLGGDYPASLTSELKRRTGARSVLFASGAVGDASPKRPKAATQQESARALGVGLADELMAALPSAHYDREPVVGNLRLVVDLPSVRIPFFARKLRFSPLSSWWIADQRTHLHAVRLGRAILTGFPGDYSGQLADQLVKSTHHSGLSVVATSFDGDFRGYLVSEPVFREKPRYETRLMNFYGPWAGDYLNDLARRMIGRLMNDPTASVRPDLASLDLAPRLAMGALLASTIALGWQWSRQLGEGIGRVGVSTTLIASAALITFEIDPDLTSWACFGLPGWARLVGLPLGFFTLLIRRRLGLPKAVMLLTGSYALLSSSWVIVLMIGRGWARSGLVGDCRPSRSRTNSGDPKAVKKPEPYRADRTIAHL